MKRSHSPSVAVSPEAQALLDAARERESIPSDVEARVLARLSESLSLAPPPAGSAPPSNPPAPRFGFRAWPAWTKAAAVLVLGAAGASAATLMAGRSGPAPVAPATQPPAVPQPELAPPLATTPSGGIPALTPTPAPAHEVAEARRPIRARPVSSATKEAQPTELLTAPAAQDGNLEGRPSSSSDAASASTLGSERRVLDQARHALARGDAMRALLVIAQHEAQFPAGELREERESLAIQALARAQRFAEARTRAAAFRDRFPQSIHQSTIDAVLQSMP